MMRSFILVLLLVTGACAQCVPAAVTADKLTDKNTPSVSFTLDFSELEPHHFVIRVDPSGAASYVAEYSVDPGKHDEDNAERVEKALTISSGTTRKIFDTARSLRYFEGNYDYTKQRIAFTGKKTLTYTDATHNTCTSLNYSENKDVMALVDLFQGIANTIELGRRLEHLYKHQRLGLYHELKTAEEMAKEGWLKEPQLIKDILDKIHNDAKVMNLARQSAGRLLPAESQP